MGGGGLVGQLDPSYTSPPTPQKYSSRIVPCISGKTPASHTLNIGAFMTKHVKIQENTNTNRLGMESECIICIRFSIKKNNNQGRPPPPLQEEKILSIFILKMKILPHNVYPRCRRKIGENINKQSAKRAHKAPFAFVFQKNSRGDPDIPTLNNFFFDRHCRVGGAPLKSATGTPPLNF